MHWTDFILFSKTRKVHWHLHDATFFFKKWWKVFKYCTLVQFHGTCPSPEYFYFYFVMHSAFFFFFFTYLIRGSCSEFGLVVYKCNVSTVISFEQRVKSVNKRWSMTTNSIKGWWTTGIGVSVLVSSVKLLLKRSLSVMTSNVANPFRDEMWVLVACRVCILSFWSLNRLLQLLFDVRERGNWSI